MARSSKDAVRGHSPHGPGFEWQGRRALYQWTQPGRFSKQRASRVHRKRTRLDVVAEASDAIAEQRDRDPEDYEEGVWRAIGGIPPCSADQGCGQAACEVCYMQAPWTEDAA